MLTSVKNELFCRSLICTTHLDIFVQAIYNCFQQTLNAGKVPTSGGSCATATSRLAVYGATATTPESQNFHFNIL